MAEAPWISSISTSPIAAPISPASSALLWAQPAVRHLARLVENAFLEAGQTGLNHRHRKLPEGCDAEQPAILGGNGGRARHRGLGHRERNDLDRRHHLFRLDHGIGGQGPQGHRLVDQIEPVEPLAIENQQSLGLCEQIGAAGERRGGRDPRAGGSGGDAIGGGVLADIARFETDDRDLVDPRRGDFQQIGRGQDATLLQRDLAQPQAVDEDRAFRLGNRGFAEPHPRPKGRRGAARWSSRQGSTPRSRPATPRRC
jgi:hypothetical protein